MVYEHWTCVYVKAGPIGLLWTAGRSGEDLRVNPAVRSRLLANLRVHVYCETSSVGLNSK